METASNADLPVDVIHKILLMLPVKTLMRFKCVCKEWCIFIESPRFVNEHFSHESNPDCLLIRLFKPNENHLTYALYADESGFGYQEPDHLQMPDEALYLMGPLRGVFCVINKSEHIALFNPAMRQFRPIPSHDSNGNEVYEYVAGFGLDPSSGDYSVIALPHLSESHAGRVCIYNSGSDSWRHIENVGLATKIKNSRDADCTCLGGIHYWETYREDDGAHIILALDSSDNFQEIRVPDCLKYPVYFRLAVYGDSIALLSFGLHSTDQCINVWVMKEVGCWTRISTLGPIEGLNWPNCLWKNSEIVLEIKDATSLTRCNVSTGILRTIEVPGKKCGKVWSYKESLVSIKNDGDSCKLWDTSSRFVKDWFSQNSNTW